MNKGLIIIIGVVVLLVIGFLVYKLIPRGNKELEITKDISAGIPFRIEYEIKDTDIVEFVRSYVLKDENTGGKVGAKVYTNYVFKGLKEGETVITFKMVSITNEYEPSNIEEYKVKVDSNLNITLVE